MIKVYLVLFILLLTFMVTPWAEARPKSVGVIPYKTWKLKKLAEAKSIVETLKHDLKKAHKRKRGEDELHNLRSRLYQATLNLEVVQSLNANDYFVLYLMVVYKNNESAFREATRHLSKDEMADIMSAYRKQTVDKERISAPRASLTRPQAIL